MSRDSDRQMESPIFVAEQKIQRILLDLDEKLAASDGQRIEAVDVDMRRFANMRVDIVTHGIIK